ncbi:TPA: MFS transporter, partial [Escherichia coli]|nr:MFS transporter [Escherichia coli]
MVSGFAMPKIRRKLAMDIPVN